MCPRGIDLARHPSTMALCCTWTASSPGLLPHPQWPCGLGAAHEKANPCQEFFPLSMIFFQFFPFSQAASVATLPSALVVVSRSHLNSAVELLAWNQKIS